MISYKQILTINKEGNKEYISTGATINTNEYISLPTILGLYNTTDPTLRKYLKQSGIVGKDYFLSDGRIYILKDFLKRNHFYLKNEKTSTYHPYRKERILGSKVPYTLISHTNNYNSENTNKMRIIKELEKINWDYFITIHLNKLTSKDDWDYYMLNFIDELSSLLGSNNVVAGYSKELSNKGFIANNKYEKNHNHIHILLHRDSKSINLVTIKALFLSVLGKKKFRKGEFDIRTYDSNQNAIEYILKDYCSNDSNFSLVVPRK